MSLKYEPASEPLHISAKWLFLNRELYLSQVVPPLSGLTGTTTLLSLLDYARRPGVTGVPRS